MRTVEEIRADLLDAIGEERYSLIGKFNDELRATITDGIPFDRLEAICEAEKDGRLVVLPDIPYNKTLYWIWGDEIMPVRYKGIRGGTVTRDGAYHVTCDMTTKKPRSFPYTYRRKEGINIYLAGDKRMFYVDDIGKTVFLTRDEAEKALEGKK